MQTEGREGKNYSGKSRYEGYLSVNIYQAAQTAAEGGQKSSDGSD